ncbi:MAG TPA: EfeM/EfeO family lipoprotein [Kofleriaceae bacterium]|nr:EfeM/EfeO family lipoprotein [Kofleriaceae bacterium]
MNKFNWISLIALAACGDNGGVDDAKFKSEVVANMHDSIARDLAELVTAAQDLQAAAPAPAGRGWDLTMDADAIAAMKDAWVRTRVAYEHVEGATAPIFPDEDVTMDARYDDCLAILGPTGDPDAFDGAGVTGMHAIERILYSNQIENKVTDFESVLPGYAVARFPGTAAEAMELKTGLCQKLIDDASKLVDEWQPAAIDIGAAYQGLVGLMNEQAEKVNLAATGEEESRYSQMTLFDLRNNLDGTTKIYKLFQPWIQAKGADDPDGNIETGFGHLDGLYAADAGDALPPVPESWSSDMPTATDLATPFGMLWQGVHQAVDPAADGSIVFEMNDVATVLGFPEFVEQ